MKFATASNKVMKKVFSLAALHSKFGHVGPIKAAIKGML
jgi:hypothetical protein